MKVAIIGASQPAMHPLGSVHGDLVTGTETFADMVRAVRLALDTFFPDTPLSAMTLVSGGSSWADHVAVELAREAKALVLELPCRLGRNAFLPTHASSARSKRTAHTLNRCHDYFSLATERHSYAELRDALWGRTSFLGDASARASYTCHATFLARNRAVAAQADALIALTCVAGDAPAPGTGTHYTWERARCWKVHIDIGSIRRIDAQEAARVAWHPQPAQRDDDDDSSDEVVVVADTEPPTKRRRLLCDPG